MSRKEKANKPEPTDEQPVDEAIDERQGPSLLPSSLLPHANTSSSVTFDGNTPVEHTTAHDGIDLDYVSDLAMKKFLIFNFGADGSDLKSSVDAAHDLALRAVEYAELWKARWQ